LYPVSWENGGVAAAEQQLVRGRRDEPAAEVRSIDASDLKTSNVNFQSYQIIHDSKNESFVGIDLPTQRKFKRLVAN
jgi:hypothetical protein